MILVEGKRSGATAVPFTFLMKARFSPFLFYTSQVIVLEGYYARMLEVHLDQRLSIIIRFFEYGAANSSWTAPNSTSKGWSRKEPWNTEEFYNLAIGS